MTWLEVANDGLTWGVTITCFGCLECGPSSNLARDKIYRRLSHDAPHPTHVQREPSFYSTIPSSLLHCNLIVGFLRR